MMSCARHWSYSPDRKRQANILKAHGIDPLTIDFHDLFATLMALWGKDVDPKAVEAAMCMILHSSPARASMMPGKELRGGNYYYHDDTV